LKKLDVKYTLVCGNIGGYGETYYLSSLSEIQKLCLEFLEKRFGGLSYITMTNSRDGSSDYGIPELSSLASYLSASREGIVLNSPVYRLSENIFGADEQQYSKASNDICPLIKAELDSFLILCTDLEMYWSYVDNSPYLAILADPYSIPFHYIENPSPSDRPMNEDNLWLATDDYYADLNDDMLDVELALGRVLALTKGGVSALISRSLFYNQYMNCWKADSRVNTIKNAEWKDTAYAAKGDDWNGAMWISTGDYWNEVQFLQSEGYSVHTTQRRTTGATVSQDVLHYYSSSSLIYVMAHGSDDGYQMVDGVESSEVKGWDMGPSVQILTSCSAARIDVNEIENTISLTFIEVGVNAYIGGSRTENTGDSPPLSSMAIEGMVSSDNSVGIACRNAKNNFNLEDGDYDSAAIRVLYGEPAFNPYQP
jgi:hypothetical protein